MVDRINGGIDHDKITVRYTEIGPSGEKVVREEVPIVDRLPKSLAGLRNYGLPKGVDIVDLRGLTPKDVGSTVTLDGKAFGGNVTVPVEKGMGSAPLAPGVEVAIYVGHAQRALTQDHAMRDTRSRITKKTRSW